MVLPGLAPPSEDEAKRYYHRLPSRPRLMGRTLGKELWQARFPGAGVHPCSEEIATIGQHKIVPLWDDILESHVMGIIKDLPWTSVDVVRIGLKSTKRSNKPVVVWIGVSTADIPWLKIADVLRACRVVLDKQGLDDVEVEIRVVAVAQAAGPALLPADIHRNSDVDSLRQLYTTAIGQSFASALTPGIQGTLGIYLWAARPGNSTYLFALTCRHVSLPEEGFQGNLPYPRQYQSQPANKMVIPASSSMGFWSTDIKNLVEARKRSLQSTRQELNADPRLIQEEEDLLHSASEWKRTADSLQPIDNRVMGEVFFSPSIGQAYHNNNSNNLPWTRDWCLREMTRLLNPHPRSPHKFIFPESGLLHLSGVIPMEELRKPNMVDKDGEDCIVVGKRGSASGLTFGTANEIDSVVRRYCGLEEFISREWLVAGFDKRNVFSEVGDSGSVIFDIYGRVGGLLTGGSLSECTANDLTYATPMAQLLPDIIEHVGYEVKMV